MINRCSIEISPCDNSKSKDKGDLLENISQLIFQKMHYNTITELRKTAMEIDVSAKSLIGNKKIYIECKAWKDNINSEVISKLLGNAFVLDDYDEAVLITTGPLGKEVKGIWENRDKNLKLKNFSIIQSQDIISILIDNNEIKDPVSLQIDKDLVFDYTLLITEFSYFWAVKLNSTDSFVNSLILFNAKTGAEIRDEDLLSKVKNTDNSLKNFEWIIRSQETYNVEARDNIIKNLHDNIIFVNSGDDWFDTRPSRPVDFVGRKNIINKIIKFYDDVLQSKTRTRVFSIMSPSGLGKSSLLIKIKEEAEKKYNKKAYVCNIDVRSANTENYINYVLFEVFKKLNDDGFVKININNIKFSNIKDFFINKEISNAIKQLCKMGKLLVINFDQFEEIISKIEFEKIFNDIKNLCFIFEELNTNLIIGFSWKTDFSISPNHPVYEIWNNLKDHRVEYWLDKFSYEDCLDCLKKYIHYSKFGNIGKLLSNYLITESNSLPWLLKKLCIHLENTYDNINNELEILIEGIKKEKIFEQDLTGLNAQDNLCLKAIAINSPADYFDMLDNYDKSVDNLIDRRLVIKRGNKLVLYWDIFKDYILNGTTPKFEISFLPITHYSTILNTLKILANNRKINIKDLAKSINLKENTTTNIIIDLAKFDLINRDSSYISLKDMNLENNIKKIVKIMSTHAVTQALYKIDNANYEDFIKIMHKLYNYNSKTLITYSNKLYSWLKACNLINFEKPFQHSQDLYYYIESTYKNVINVLNSIVVNKSRKTDFTTRKDKQVIQFLIKSHIITLNKDIIIGKKTIKDVIDYIKTLPPYILASEYMDSLQNKRNSTAGLATFLRCKFNQKWTESASRRYANWIHSWYNKINSLPKNQISFLDS